MKRRNFLQRLGGLGLLFGLGAAQDLTKVDPESLAKRLKDYKEKPVEPPVVKAEKQDDGTVEFNHIRQAKDFCMSSGPASYGWTHGGFSA